MKKSILTLAVLLLGLSMAGCAARQKEPSFQEFAWGKEGPVDLTGDQHEQAGDGFLRRGNSEMAFVHYNKALEKDPENLGVRIKKGDLLVTKGLDEQALAEYLHVLQKEPDHAIANEAAGSVYFRAGLYAEAETHLSRAVDGNPMLWKAQNYLGNLYDRQGRYEDARAHFLRALELHQGQFKDEIYNNLGVVQIALKQYGDAVNSFRYALKNGGVSPRTYNNLGLALARQGRLVEALEAFKYAGGESRANNNLGYVLLADGRAAESVPYFERAVELAPSYYVKAAENLKRARMAARFADAQPEAAAAEIQTSGSTPNPLPRDPFPGAGQNPGGPAASPAAAGPPSGDVRPIAWHPGTGDAITSPTWGMHVSSWRDHGRAFRHCRKLAGQGYEPWINQVDLGDKGIWYRVLVGRYPSVNAARADRAHILGELKLDRAPIYELVTPALDGSHLRQGE
ncbi:tetratricopeptide repeat protein [Pseudodesulfovibrio sp.]|uniref:SPOR domain-containing protein n=1 Tax=Pseudodesulfovibrio sp. TaxID=2035812 RepID=UPI00262C01C0|nr:tetratricopeptide repeat protein [Pseudodesulfovibrio sp.]MDD3311546.1 tetratricopeptide repeat protein [Pseudodesulfovibrio sp.]